MARSFLKFVGSASAVVWATLLTGTLFSASADAAASPPVSSYYCTECYSCNAAKTACTYTGAKADCTKNSCNCNTNNGNAICKSK